MRFGSSKCALILAVSALLAGPAVAQQAPHADGGGRPSASASAAFANISLGRIAPSFRFNNASFASGAVGLRNRGEGGIAISGVTPPVKTAFAYWAVVTAGPPTVAVSSILMKRGVRSGAFTNIRGTVIGSGPSPCWSGDRVTVFRGIIPRSLARGNGLYLILLRPGANGSTAGQSPWVESNLPLFEGVSIVLVGSGNATVAVYDRNFAGAMFFGRLSYRLNTPVSVNGAAEVLFHNIGADGQTGVGLDEIAATAGEITFLNNHRIAGPGSPAGSGDWNGSVAAPLPQLWDNTTHDVTAEARRGNSRVLQFVIDAPDDCLVTVANLLSIRRR